MKITIEIPGNPITKKNSQRIVQMRGKGGKPGRSMIIPSQQYKVYEAAAMVALKEWKPRPPITGPVQITCIYYMRERRKVDLTNLMEATDDILVRAGVLEDDNREVVASHDGSRVYHDPERPRVEITITDMQDYPLWKDDAQKPVKRARKAKEPVMEDFDNEHWD